MSAQRGQQTPEQAARAQIDAELAAAGWVVQDRDAANVAAARGVAVREFPLASGHGFADYLLFVDEHAVGVLEAKPAGHTLSGVEHQAIQKYSGGLPESLDAPVRPLPFIYMSTGTETQFTNLLDPEPRSRHLFHLHRPAQLAEWLEAKPLPEWGREWIAAESLPAEGAYGARPSTLRQRVRHLPPVDLPGLWPHQARAIRGLEASFAQDKPRALIQMATGSGKTVCAITSIYRLIKFGGARRVLFLVDRTNLGEQAEKEFQSYQTPDDRRKFTELYNVQLLRSNTVMDSSRVVITTIQRLYSMLKGEELDPELEQGSQFDATGQALSQPATVAYNPAIPVEFFDVIFVDECHRSIYTLWRQVLDYFDAHIVGLTATPGKHTYGFFDKNLVMEYPHEEAVADGVNVDFDVYRIRTRITAQGSTVEAGPDTVVGVRDRGTRELRWERPDEDITYGSEELDRRVVAKDQIRTIIRTFKDKVCSDIFPGRTEVPKTLIFAKDDSHAEDIVGIVREEFGKGNDFAQKITYKTTGAKPQDLIQDFRRSYNPRIAVTVDMVATGTDIRPVEIVMFMRRVKSRQFFEQMKGRGVRVIDPNELLSVTPDAKAKTHFVVVDTVGVCEEELADTQPLERKRSVSFKALLEHVAFGGTDPDMLSSLASRLARLDRQCGAAERDRIATVGETTLHDLTHAIVDALDPDRQVEAARERFGLGPNAVPEPAQCEEARTALAKAAVEPLKTRPKLRELLQDLKRQYEQYIDVTSVDEVLEAGASPEAREKAREITRKFERYLEEHKDEIEALRLFYAQPYNRRLTYKEIKELSEAIALPPRAWTPERLWRAYELLDANRVRGASAERRLVDLVSLVRFALHEESELAPYRDKVLERFDNWLAQQETAGRAFTPEQRRWLEMMRDHVAASLEITPDDFGYTPFAERGGLARASQVFGDSLGALIDELNEALAA